MFQLSVCAGTVLQDLPFLERLREIARAGFMVDLWGWEEASLDEIAADPKITISCIPGWQGGSMVHPDGVAEFLDGVQTCVDVANRLGVHNLGIGTGAIDKDLQVAHEIADHPGALWITAYQCMSRVAEIAEQHDVTFAFEIMNTKVDHPGYPMPLIQDGIQLVRAVGSPRVRLLFDVYHAQIEEGNVVELIQESADYIGYVHVADVPGRHEPGTGEINYPRIAQALRDIGYEGHVGMEAYPTGDDHAAMERFRELFS